MYIGNRRYNRRSKVIVVLVSARGVILARVVWDEMI